MRYGFGRCELNTQTRELRVDGRLRATLTNKAFAVLLHLMEHGHQLVTKEALLTTVWPGAYVTEGALTQHIKRLRQLVGDSGMQPHVIKTVRGVGYRFVAAVTLCADEHHAPPASLLADRAAAASPPRSVLSALPCAPHHKMAAGQWGAHCRSWGIHGRAAPAHRARVSGGRRDRPCGAA